MTIPRRTKRANYPFPLRFEATEDDLDTIDNKLDSQNRLLMGILASTVTAALTAVVNLVSR